VADSRPAAGRGTTLQVQDDLNLLEKMMADLEGAPDAYRPTNYWHHYQRSFLPELKFRGLKSFRRRQFSVLESFGAVDGIIQAAVRLRRSFRGAGKITRFLNWLMRRSPFFKLEVADIDPRGVTPYFYFLVKEKFVRAGFDLDKCPTNALGDLEDMEEISGGAWSRTYLQYCSMFADSRAPHPLQAGFRDLRARARAGAKRAGFAQLLEGATFLLFDIPPQLYVANQYLKASFGPRVIPYDQAVGLAPEGAGLPGQVRGKILMLPSWKLPEWSRVKIDLFWNSASFQEMEPNVVRNYLGLAAGMSPEWIYINAMPRGNYWGEWKPGRGGTKTPVTENVYLEALKGSRGLAATYETDYFLRARDHKSYVFKRLSS